MIKRECKVCGQTKTSFISEEVAQKGGLIFTIPALQARLGAASFLAGSVRAIASTVMKKSYS